MATSYKMRIFDSTVFKTYCILVTYYIQSFTNIMQMDFNDFVFIELYCIHRHYHCSMSDTLYKLLFLLKEVKRNV